MTEVNFNLEIGFNGWIYVYFIRSWPKLSTLVLECGKGVRLLQKPGEKTRIRLLNKWLIFKNTEHLSFPLQSVSTSGNLPNLNVVLEIVTQLSILNNLHPYSCNNFYINWEKKKKQPTQTLWVHLETADLTKSVFSIKLHNVNVVKTSGLVLGGEAVDYTWHIHFTQSLTQPALGSLIHEYIFPEKWVYVNFRNQKDNSALKTARAVWEIHISSLKNEVNCRSSEKCFFYTDKLQWRFFFSWKLWIILFHVQRKVNQQSWCSEVSVHLISTVILDFSRMRLFMPGDMELVWMPVDSKRCLLIRSKNGELVYWVESELWKICELKKTVRGKPWELGNVQWLKHTAFSLTSLSSNST